MWGRAGRALGRYARAHGAVQGRVCAAAVGWEGQGNPPQRALGPQKATNAPGRTTVLLRRCAATGQGQAGRLGRAEGGREGRARHCGQLDMPPKAGFVHNGARGLPGRTCGRAAGGKLFWGIAEEGRERETDGFTRGTTANISTGERERAFIPAGRTTQLADAGPVQRRPSGARPRPARSNPWGGAARAGRGRLPKGGRAAHELGALYKKRCARRARRASSARPARS